MSANKYTFKGLLTENKVEIPVLQRDYVQGNKKYGKAEDIGHNFTVDLVTHLSHANCEEFVLNFVYGKMINDSLEEHYEKNEQHLGILLETVKEYADKSGFLLSSEITRKEQSKNTFIPFDGQQRLTTLFLLHFLVYSYLGKDISYLDGFLYKTRASSRDFLKALIKNKEAFQGNENWVSSFEEYIVDQNWFYDKWRYDPTVSSMLSMMENFRIAIGQNDRTLKCETIYNNLERNNILTFNYLDISEKDLSDELYIKMNASGKDLTDFEKFKSWLLEYIQKKEIKISVENWSEKLDTVWYDVFWNNNRDQTDYCLYNFFKQLILLNVLSQKTDNKDLSREEILKVNKIKRSIYDTLNSSDAVSFTFFEIHNLITADSLSSVFNTLEFLSSENFSDLENEIKKIWNETFFEKKYAIGDVLVNRLTNYYIKFHKERIRFNLFDKTFVFAVINYLHLDKSKQPSSLENFKNWIRIIRNLIYNARIDDYSQFLPAIQSIKEFGTKCLDIKANIRSENFIDFFTERQRKEEYRKNLHEFASWQDYLIAAENDHYFYGQINFLIEMSQDRGIPNLDKFIRNLEIVSKIFSPSNLDNNFLVCRALLTINDEWMPPYGSERFLFCLPSRANSRNRDENWRRVFNREDKSKGIEVLQELIHVFPKYNNLNELILNRKSAISDWRRLILEFPNELKYCQQGLIKWQNEGDYVRLLGQSRLSHYHRELRTSVLLNNFFTDIDEKEKYYGEQRSDESCYAQIVHGPDRLRIRWNYKDLKFEIYIVNNDLQGEEIESLLPEEALEKSFNTLFTILKKYNPYIKATHD